MNNFFFYFCFVIISFQPYHLCCVIADNKLFVDVPPIRYFWWISVGMALVYDIWPFGDASITCRSTDNGHRNFWCVLYLFLYPFFCCCLVVVSHTNEEKKNKIYIKKEQINDGCIRVNARQSFFITEKKALHNCLEWSTLFFCLMRTRRFCFIFSPSILYFGFIFCSLRLPLISAWLNDTFDQLYFVLGK